VSRATVSVFRPTKQAADVVFSAAGLVAVVEIWRKLKKGIFDPYRPELHYMRGPGPKWREKHAHAVSKRATVQSPAGHPGANLRRALLWPVPPHCRF
jgi:hypothetical protein